MGIAPVSSLLFSRSPFHIALLIIPVVVDSFNGVLWAWLWPKFCKKFFKRGKEESDSATAIVCVPWKIRVVASRERITESGVFLGLLSCLSLTVLCASLAKYIIGETAAGPSIPRAKDFSAKDLTVSAFAKAAPHCPTVLSDTYEFYDRKTAKDFSGNIYRKARMLLSHVMPTSRGRYFGESRIGIGVPCGSFGL